MHFSPFNFSFLRQNIHLSTLQSVFLHWDKTLSFIPTKKKTGKFIVPYFFYVQDISGCKRRTQI